MELKFKTDVKHRKEWFTPDSFSHPAKMSLPLSLWIVQHYTETGETILDPMAGSGTTMLACTLGRNVVLVELEQKFCKMMRDNWGEVRMRPQLGYQMGQCEIMQGDARQLENILCDSIITSPPYASDKRFGREFTDASIEGRDNHLAMKYGDTEGQIANLPYGQIDKIVTSPPYAGGEQFHDIDFINKEQPRSHRPQQKQAMSNLPYGNIDSIITSPPFANQLAGGEKIDPNYEYGSQGKSYAPIENKAIGGSRKPEVVRKRQLSRNIGNINVFGNKGRLSMDSYLEAMLQVYQQCFSVLKSGGFMILVTKNFLRDRQEIRLDTDTIALCEKVGFLFVERHYRVLPSQSFWRIIYQKRYPDAPVIDREDVLVFLKN